MDLLERGRSLGELGRTLRWSDIRAMLLRLPPTSHVRRVVAPEAARTAEWTTPTVTMLGVLHDSWEADMLLRRGVAVEALPQQGVIGRILTSQDQPEGQEKKPAPAPAPSVADRDVKAREAAARIRAGL